MSEKQQLISSALLESYTSCADASLLRGPPAYSSKSLSGLESDLQLARGILSQHAHTTPIIAVFRCGKNAIEMVPWAAAKCAALMPLFWLSLPRYIIAGGNAEILMKQAIYILTEESLIMAAPEVGRYHEVELETIVDIAVEIQSEFHNVPGIVITLPGMHSEGPACARRMEKDTVVVYCDDVERVANLIRTARKNAKTSGRSVAVSMPAPAFAPETPSAQKRLFVAHSKNGQVGSWQVMMTSSTETATLQQAVAAKLHLQGEVRCELDNMGVTLSSFAEVQNNDKIVVFTSTDAAW
jgi:hypothetical protein